MLLDDFMPESDVRASHATRIAASPERVYACLWTADFDHWGLTRALYALRALPRVADDPREAWRRVRVELRPHRVTLDDMLGDGFTLLGGGRARSLCWARWVASGAPAEKRAQSVQRASVSPRLRGRPRRHGASLWTDGQVAPNSGPRLAFCARTWQPAGASARFGC
jgi:hypothetical protein